MAGREHTLCFTGHRHYIGSPVQGASLAATLSDACGDGYHTFISGMAQGFDLAAAEAVVKLREKHGYIRLVAAVPFPRQAAKYSAADKKRYEMLLSAADEIAVLSESYSYGCYYMRDDWMVEHSSRIICWYDGSEGGTRYTVKSALRTGLDIVNIYRAEATLF